MQTTNTDTNPAMTAALVSSLECSIYVASLSDYNAGILHGRWIDCLQDFDASGVPARLIIERGKMTTYNANRPHGFGLLAPETAVPYPKNPVLGDFFREIDRADELGSGMRKMMLYGKKYGGADPQLEEGDTFRMVISVPEFDFIEKTQELSDNFSGSPQVGPRSGPSRDQVGTKWKYCITA